MRKENLERLLDSIYELEGLVHLAMNRDDEPAMLPELIRRKSRELLQHAEGATGAEAVAEPIPSTVDESASAPAVKLANETIEEEEAEAEVTPEPADETETAPLPEPESEEVVKVSESRQKITDLKQSLSAFREELEVTGEVTPKPEREIPVPKPEKETYKFDDYSEPRGRLVFSINDRYRFRRELFNGSDVDFNTTLSLVASMDDFEEAQDYFLDELQWDEKSPDVIDFLEILKNYFK